MCSLISTYEHVNIYRYQILHKTFCSKCSNLVTIWQYHIDEFNLLNEIFYNLKFVCSSDTEEDLNSIEKIFKWISRSINV